jgi:hypothetical protein
MRAYAASLEECQSNNLEGQPEELATPPPDSVQSANWETNLTISTFGSEPAPQPVDITLSSASVNVTDYKGPPLQPLSTLSADSQAILYV